jgi:hypothetical protein
MHWSRNSWLPREPGDELLFRELDDVFTRREEAGVADPGVPSVSFADPQVRVLGAQSAGKNSSFIRASSSTTWSFHAVHSISAMTSAP